MYSKIVKVYTQLVLTVIAILLAVIALRPAADPRAVSAQANVPEIYIEPGTTTLRKPDGTASMQGKVVIDLNTGDIFGFPTLTRAPYPIDSSDTKPPVSEPMYLGRFDFSKMHRPSE
jgi:hypothetical protein